LVLGGWHMFGCSCGKLAFIEVDILSVYNLSRFNIK
jgi:hypothetical protein